MSMLSRCTTGAIASKKARSASPLSAPIPAASAGEVSGPVATMTLSQSSGGRPSTSSRRSSYQRMTGDPLGDGGGKRFAVDGERPAGRHLVSVRGAQHERAHPNASHDAGLPTALETLAS